MHAQSSENLTKNIIMRSAESIESGNRAPGDIKNRANQTNFVRKKQISEIVQGKSSYVQNFEITSKASSQQVN